ncbi:MAG: nucleotidyl transferase AbiEii/AbiGii toxin family protein [Gammaproteobacteria bacterium]|nr:nucleotidyl transferase AbiEii/AbiGii toxin family protein [Gammaproteobacteria bacterium]
MNLFDQLVTEALKNQPNLSPLRVVVEKELLHHDILRVMRDLNLTSHLTFIGGSCLRCCYGGVRLSENLDFTGGNDFSRDNLSFMGQKLTKNLQDKYELQVAVSEPIRDKQNIDTWKVKIETRPEAKHLPAQRINIDICALPSYEKRPMMLLNPYGVDMGTSGLIIQAQSREEIYTDKLIAFSFRQNRIKYRDLWDIMWLHGQGLKPRLELIPNKLKDRHHTTDSFLNLFDTRAQLLKKNPKMATEFKKEMCRFLSTKQVNESLEQENLWGFITYLIEDLGHQIKKNIRR